MVHVEAHDKLEQQVVNRIYHLINHQHYWKGMYKSICNYIDNCALHKREKARTQVYLLQTTDIPDRPFDKIAMDLVSDLNVSASGNQHILTIIDHLMDGHRPAPTLTRKQIPLFMFSSIIICLFTCVLTSYCQTMEQNSRTWE